MIQRRWAASVTADPSTLIDVRRAANAVPYRRGHVTWRQRFDWSLMGAIRYLARRSRLKSLAHLWIGIEWHSPDPRSTRPSPPAETTSRSRHSAGTRLPVEPTVFSTPIQWRTDGRGGYRSRRIAEETSAKSFRSRAPLMQLRATVNVGI